MPKRLDKKTQIYRALERLYSQDIKRESRLSKSIEKDLQKLISKEITYEKSSIAKARKKVSESKSKSKLIKTRKVTKTVINKKLDLNYKAFQKNIMLPTPLRMTKKLLTGRNFEQYLHEFFYNEVYKFFSDSKNFFSDKYTLATIGYHFFFKRGNKKTYQSGFRKPRQQITKSNIDRVIKVLFKQTFDRFDIYFKTRGSSALYFEGITTEISFDIKSKRGKK